MKLRRVSPLHFMVPSQVTLELPERGVVVLTGPNGAGKSRFIEACAYAVSGKTLRGANPWRAGEAGSVIVESYDGWSLQRTTTAKGTKKFLVNGVKADTNTKTKDWIDIDLELWRRTHVFSSSDAAHFSTATDTLRKDLIEQILGLSVFDQAVDKCKADQDKNYEELVRAKLVLAKAQGNMQTVQAQLSGWQEPAQFEPHAPPPAPCPEPNVAELEPARAELVRLADAITEAHKRTYPPQVPADLVEKRTLLWAKKLQYERRGAATSLGRCAECDSAFTGLELEAAQEELSRVLAEVDAVGIEILASQNAQESARKAAQAELCALQERQGELGAKAYRMESDGRLWATWQKQEADWRRREDIRREQHALQANARVAARGRLELALAEHTAERDEVQGYVTSLERDGLELSLARDALKALRGIVLSRALGGIEAVANGWLRRVGQAEVRLRPYTENKTGGVSDKISLELEGYAGGEGYKGASGGERRRVDTALLLALCEVAGAAAGRNDGTIFLDEALDGLDTEGRALFGTCLEELGRARCIVLITHWEDMAMAVAAVAKYRVVPGGALEKIG